MAGESTSAEGPQRILFVTGLLGAGKTTALRTLEDLGWEAIDNFPIRLLDRLLGTGAVRLGESQGGDRSGDRGAGPIAIGFDTRTRGFDPAQVIAMVKGLSARPGLSITTLFLDCNGAELERRYNETRRRHPMSSGPEGDRPAVAGIQAERELLEPLRRWADLVIDTSRFSANDLQHAIRAQFGETAPGPAALTLTVSSFGFSRGTPPLADFVFDMRFLDNPHWDNALRPQTGLDAPVGDYIRRDGAFAPAVDKIVALLLDVLPAFVRQGKAYLHVAFGCTGGRHRSVFTAETVAAALREAGWAPTVLHRNLSARGADMLEKERR